MAAIEALELRKTYPGPVESLRGLSFTAAEGEVFALLGPNGAGKSTTVRILATLTRPTAGSARVGGCDVVDDAPEVRRRLGYVAQSSAVDVLATGRENLVLQGRLFGLRGEPLRNRVAELLELFDLEDSASRIVRTYSGGMKRRLDLAMGLVHRPRILLLDEPTTGLDPESRQVVWREVEQLVSGEGLTVLLTTHYLEEADRLASNVAIVDNGLVVAQGSPDELKQTLQGDRVSVGLAEGDDAAAAADVLRERPEIGEVIVEAAFVHAQVPRGAEAVPGILQALERAGVAVTQVTINRPSLDDVYLHITGKSLRHATAEAEATPVAAEAP